MHVPHSRSKLRAQACTYHTVGPEACTYHTVVPDANLRVSATTAPALSVTLVGGLATTYEAHIS